jgi:hypothetical protein
MRPSAQPPVHPDRCLAAADLNKDGRLDVAVVDGDSDRILVLFGNGDGTFGNPVLLNSGVRSYFIAASDFNGDGIPDLITAATVQLGTPFLRAADPSGIAVLLSRGDGAFETPKILATRALAETVAIGDVDHDGKLDLVGTSTAGYTSVFSYWRGNGDGTFQPPVDHPFDIPGFAYALADVNRDGNLDVLATTTDGVLVFLGNGDGTFRAFVKSQSSQFLPSIKVADLNGDGRPDIVLSYRSDSPAIQLGNGDGTFEAPIHLGYPEVLSQGSLELADFNDDGVADLALADGDSIRVYVGRNNGRFDQLGTFTSPSRIFGFWPGDWNGDGNVDLLAYGALGTANWIFESDGRGNFRPARTEDLPGLIVLAVADLNSDGKTDLIVQLAPNEVGVSLSEANYQFSPPKRLFRLEQGRPAGIVPTIERVLVCDWNRDGNPDLVISFANAAISYNTDGATLLLGNGDGTFTESADSPLFGILAVADFNRDGIPDLLTTQYQILFGSGEGSFGTPAMTSGFPSGCGNVGVADVNGDRVPDVVCFTYNWDGPYSADVYRGDGSGNFSHLPTESLEWLGFLPQFADFSGDGIPDVILSLSRDQRAVYLGDGNGGFTLGATLPGSGGNVSLAPSILDLNRDGKPDLIIPDGTHRFSVFLSNSGRSVPNGISPGRPRRGGR